MNALTRHLPVLQYLQRQLTDQLKPGDSTHMQYPTPISSLLGFNIVGVGEATAVIELLADAAIGTAHSTLMQQGESFTSIDLKAVFLCPVWQARLRAHARATHQGRSISHYQCDILREDNKVVATITSTVMTLRGTQAQGR